MGAHSPDDQGVASRAGRLKRLAATDWKTRARQVASSLKAEYEAGKQGDDTPAKPIWATPQQQLDGLLAIFRQTTASRPVAATAVPTEDAVDTSDSTGSARIGAGANDADATDAAEVAAAISGVDWAGVRAATAERTTEATRAMKSMAEHVDWAKVQPVAAQVSSALIAAIATGQLGVGGRLASTVARTITNQNGLGQRVAAELHTPAADAPIDFRAAIEAASREA